MSIIVTHEYFSFFYYHNYKIQLHRIPYDAVLCHISKKCKTMLYDAIQYHTMFDNEEFVFLTRCSVL